GEDLIFPHHENEIAQSESATGKPFVRYWIHNAMLNLTGEKMSKSTKHFITAKELLAKYSPNVLRLYFLKSHYRSPLEFDFNILDSTKEGWARIEDFLNQAEEEKIKADTVSEEIQNAFKQAMDDDLNTPKVVALIFDAVKDGFNALQTQDLIQLKQKYSEVQFYLNNLGFRTDVEFRMTKFRKIEIIDQFNFNEDVSVIVLSPQIEKAISIAQNKNENDIAYLLEKGHKEKDYQLFVIAREIARTKKLFEIADLIRDRLEEMNFILEDTNKGTRIKRKV
ncbi:MAG: class I tRNA ligase family protein, partial [candidate division WOR-3 bacterium]|nr:class I tRNA ligase family protein [candidate division WOR-3 bacterium]